MAPVSVEPPAFEPADHEQAAGGATMALREIAVDQIVPNRRQPRTDFDEASLSTLAASIQSAGLMQPIMVRPRLNGYELVAGERRWRAAKLIGLKTIPALVKVVDDQLAAELALVENIQREDLNPMDRAHALRRLAQEFSLTHQQVADKVGLDRASITNLLRLSDLDGGTADLVRSGRLSQGHAKALLGVTDIGARAMFAAKAIAEEWSVRELERRVQVALKGGRPISEASPKTSSTDPSARDANVTDLERQLAEHLGTRVSLQLGRKKGSGRLTIEFYNLDQFDGLMLKMGFGGR
jgi:ParB family chromosome partitioning protein